MSEVGPTPGIGPVWIAVAGGLMNAVEMDSCNAIDIIWMKL